MTTEPLEEVPARECRHLLAMRGGTAGCTLKAGHGHDLHQDDQQHDQDGQPLRWSCTCRPAPVARVSVCLTFTGYDTPTETG